MSTEPHGTDLLIRELCRAMLDEVATSDSGIQRLRVTGLGRHFAIPAEDAVRLTHADGPEVTSYVSHIEAEWEPPWLADTDRTWEPLHRCLLTGPTPLRYAILGGHSLTDDSDYLTRLVPPGQVSLTAKALAEVEEGWLWGKFSDLGLRGDFHWAREGLTEVRELFALATKARRAVLFTANT
ncbi:DUF1877 family protein [Streptomyces sp. NPDC059256]|uniref:DUF1877 family protein n=1 Tax=Streptomyces sp. NPDC059256 TaxID=3346794 RepID=UPI003690DD85